MKPIIGVTMNYKEDQYFVNESYVQAIMNAGGIPICIPYGEVTEVELMINKIDGLLLTGGGDINPILYQEEPHPKLGQVLTMRDENELLWTKKALERKLPILAICRGLQILNVALGGTLYQDIYAQNQRELLLHSQKAARHETFHFVTLKENSRLFEILKKKNILVNTFHHQAIKEIASELDIVGKASDGIIEAVEHRTLHFCIGVQWHPEELAIIGEEYSVKLFQAFIDTSANEKNSHSSS